MKAQSVVSFDSQTLSNEGFIKDSTTFAIVEIQFYLDFYGLENDEFLLFWTVTSLIGSSQSAGTPHNQQLLLDPVRSPTLPLSLLPF